MTKTLSTKQKAVLDKLTKYVEINDRMPALSTLAHEMNVHYVTLKQHVKALETKGFVEFVSVGRGKSPIVKLRVNTGIPLLGSIPAGALSEAITESQSVIAIKGYSDRHFALRVTGDSMAELIQDDDLIIFNTSIIPDRSGLICAVAVEESDVTLKYVDFVPKSPDIILRPHNLDYPSLVVPGDTVRILGVYCGLLRGEVGPLLIEDSRFLN